MRKLFTLFMLIAAVSSVQAAVITYDFSATSVEGQSYEGATLGVMTLTSESGDLSYTGSYGGGLITEPSGGSTADVELTFSSPISLLSVTAGDGSGDSDAFSLYLYEFGTMNFLGRYDSPVFGGASEPEWFTLSVPGVSIGRVVFDPGEGGVLPGTLGGAGGIVITEISFDTSTATIPEPSTLGMLVLAGAAMAALRLRR